MIEIQPATSDHLPVVLEWLKAEEDECGSGFYCNRNVIAKSFARGEGLCAASEEGIIGFSVFQMFTDGGEVHIVEVKPGSRSQELGSKLLLASIHELRKSGAKYIDAECTSKEGELLCKRHGFEDYVHPRNHRDEWDNPTVRLYLSNWRPPAPNPWA